MAQKTHALGSTAELGRQRRRWVIKGWLLILCQKKEALLSTVQGGAASGSKVGKMARDGAAKIDHA
tara:strand:+ start:1428 stop:1625 length:198 start_codon:yes stop_codon:yes gene_type:complete